MPFGSEIEVGCEDINSIQFLAQQTIEQSMSTRSDTLDTDPHDPSLLSIHEEGQELDSLVGIQVWERLGLDTAPFTVQALAPMSLVHFYFSQLTLNCVFVVDKGTIASLRYMTHGSLLTIPHY